MLKVFYCGYIIVVYFKKNIRINVPKKEKGVIIKLPVGILSESKKKS